MGVIAGALAGITGLALGVDVAGVLRWAGVVGDGDDRFGAAGKVVPGVVAWGVRGVVAGVPKAGLAAGVVADGA